MSKVSDRLREIRTAMGESQKGMARRFGLGENGWQALERENRAPKGDVLAQLVELGFSSDWLISGEGQMRRGELPEALPLDGAAAIVDEEKKGTNLSNEFVLVPRYNVQASAGNGSVIYSEQIVDYLAFKADWVRGTLHMNPTWLLLIEAVGDSMEGTISDGDLLLVNIHEPRIRENAVYALNVRGTLLVKRVQVKLDGSLVVRSDNSRYEPEVIPPHEADSLRVIGQVVWHGGMMK